jgi:LPS-assembly lipoprotein
MTARRWFAFALAACLGGCGFRPVYMPTASGKAGPAQRELAAVYVPIIPERPGQLLRQALQARLRDDSGTPSKYDLQVSFGIAGEGISVQSNSLATRVRFSGSASWTLIAHDGKRSALTSGLARSMDGLNVFDSQYFASDLETEAIQARIAENLAQQIATQLAIWFRNHADG